MAGHSHAKNVMHRKAAQNNKRSKVITKISHAISVAIKMGGSIDAETNSKLKFALKQAQAAFVPKDVIKRAIDSASNKDEKNLEEVIYEGYVSGVAILVMTITDNRNKTGPEIRAAFSKYGGTISTPNTVAFMFDKVGIIDCEIKKEQFDKFFEEAVMIDATDVMEDATQETYETEGYITARAFFASENLHKAQEQLDSNWKITSAELCYIPQTFVELNDKEGFYKMLNALEENESTIACWHNLKE